MATVCRRNIRSENLTWISFSTVAKSWVPTPSVPRDLPEGFESRERKLDTLKLENNWLLDQVYKIIYDSRQCYLLDPSLIPFFEASGLLDQIRILWKKLAPVNRQLDDLKCALP